MQPDEIAVLMRNYRAYRYAVNQYEKHKPFPAAGVANYEAMPSGSGAPELFFDRVGKAADMGNTSFQDALDYEAYKEAVTIIEGALSVLTDEERDVMTKKWMQDIDLKIIAQRNHMAFITVRRIHKRAMSRMSTALRFYRLPDIEMDICSTNRLRQAQPNKFQKPSIYADL